MPIAEKNSISSSSACSLATRPRRPRIVETAADTRACDQATRCRPLAPWSEGLPDAPPRCSPVAAAVEARPLVSTTCSPSPPRSPPLDGADSVSTTSVRPPSPVGPAVRSRFTLPPSVEPGEHCDRGSDWLRRALRVVARRLPAGGPRVGKTPRWNWGKCAAPSSWLSLPGDQRRRPDPFARYGAPASGRPGHVRPARLPVIGNGSPARSRPSRRATESAPTAASLHSTVRTTALSPAVKRSAR